MLRQIYEEEAFALAGESDCPVLMKEESNAMKAAVCLKKFPGGYVLGASDQVHDLRLWFSAELGPAETMYHEFVQIMRKYGSPFAE